jgi:hypothetical protein
MWLVRLVVSRAVAMDGEDSSGSRCIGDSGRSIEKLGGSLDFAFEDLAGGTLGESIDKPHKSRVLVGGNLVLM